MSKKLLSLLLIAALCLSLAPAGLAEEIRIVDPVGANTQINDTEADAPAPCHPERSEAEPKDLSEDSSSLTPLRMTDETNEIVASGECGDNLTWTLDDEGTLTISGTGDMWDFGYWGDVPWYEENENINTTAICDGVTSIGRYAFSYCSSLTDVTIPDGVTSIGANAFLVCSSLTTVTIPNGVTSIGDRAFDGCSSLTCVTIPDSVASIGYSAFYDCTSLTSITIPGNVSTIDDYTFKKCSSLSSVTIQPGVTSIGRSAFSYCESLTNVTIPDSVRNVGESAFKYCSSLTSVNIGCGVSKINSSTFSYCDSLTDVYFNAYEKAAERLKAQVHTSYGNDALENATWHSADIKPEDGWEICGNFLLSQYDPNNCTLTIKGHGAMWGGYVEGFELPWKTFEIITDLTSIIIEPGAVSIGESAFSGCPSLSNVTIPDSVESIERNAFDYCENLSQIVIPESVKDLDFGVFWDCSNLKTAGPIGGGYNIEFGWTDEIPRYAFYGDNCLESVTIPNSVKNIGYHAFNDCGVTNLTIPGSVTSIDSYTFSDCGNLTDITFEEGITSIGYAAFRSSGVTNIRIPASLKLIGNYTFVATNLSNIYIVDVDAWCNIERGLWAIEGTHNIYLNDELLTELTIPEGITNIGFYGTEACKGCTSLTSVTIPKSVEVIDSGAFSWCNNLNNIVFLGSAPIFKDRSINLDGYHGYPFEGVTATAYYPEGDETWTEDVMQDYGGTITWVAYTPEEGYAVAIDEEKLPEGVTVTLPEGDSFSGEVTFTVSSPNDQAVLVAVKNGDGSYTVLPCTDKDGCHCFTLNVTENTELVLVYKGDANLDGQVKLKDNLMVKKHIAKSEQITDPLAVLAVDTDGSGEIKLRDNLMIKKHIAKSQMIGW